jgi:hypothetical protein
MGGLPDQSGSAASSTLILAAHIDEYFQVVKRRVRIA